MSTTPHPVAQRQVSAGSESALRAVEVGVTNSKGPEATTDGPLALERRWHISVAVLGVCLVAVVALFWSTATSAVWTWYSSRTFNHGFMILPICGYLIWVRRRQLAQMSPRVSHSGLIIFVAMGLAWLIGRTTGTLIIQQFALIVMLQALFVTVLGWRVAATMALPLLYLFFAVPAGDFLVPPLQDLTAKFVVRMLQLTQVPVFLDGIMISIPSGRFRVAETCAGVRFLIATVALGVLFASLFYQSWWRRFAFIGLSIAVPVVANGFRAFGIVMIAYITDHRIAVGVDHLIFGWIFFSFVIVILFLLGLSFRGGDPGAKPARLQRRSEHLAPPSSSSLMRSAIAGSAAIVVAVAMPTFVDYIESRSVELHTEAIPTPRVEAPWTPSETDGQWWPIFPGASVELLQSYTVGDGTVDLYIAYYGRQRQGAEVVSWQNQLADEIHWTRLGSGRMAAVIDGVESTVAYTRFGSRKKRRMVWYWYWVDDRFTASPHVAKLLQAKSAILGGKDAGAVVAISSDYGDIPAEANRVLRDFLEKLEPLKPLLSQLVGQEAVSTDGSEPGVRAIR